MLVSKLRALLDECGLDGSSALTDAFGCYKLTLPPGSWIDVAAATTPRQPPRRRSHSPTPPRRWTMRRRPPRSRAETFLPGEDGHWVEEKRAEQRAISSAPSSVSRGDRMTGDVAASGRAAEELVVLEPFRERGYRLLMQAQSAGGNDAEALRTYERCRTLLPRAWSISSPETRPYTS